MTIALHPSISIYLTFRRKYVLELLGVNLFTPQVSTHSLVMYLIKPEHAKNILQNEVAPDFAFILKIRKIHGTSVLKITVTGQI